MYAGFMLVTSWFLAGFAICADMYNQKNLYSLPLHFAGISGSSSGFKLLLIGLNKIVFTESYEREYLSAKVKIESIIDIDLR